MNEGNNFCFVPDHKQIKKYNNLVHVLFYLAGVLSSALKQNLLTPSEFVFARLSLTYFYHPALEEKPIQLEGFLDGVEVLKLNEAKANRPARCVLGHLDPDDVTAAGEQSRNFFAGGRIGQVPYVDTFGVDLEF